MHHFITNLCNAKLKTVPDELVDFDRGSDFDTAYRALCNSVLPWRRISHTFDLMKVLMALLLGERAERKSLASVTSY